MGKYKWKKNKKTNINTDQPFVFTDKSIEIKTNGSYELTVSFGEYNPGFGSTYLMPKVFVNDEVEYIGNTLSIHRNFDAGDVITFKSASSSLVGINITHIKFTVNPDFNPVLSEISRAQNESPFIEQSVSEQTILISTEFSTGAQGG